MKTRNIRNALLIIALTFVFAATANAAAENVKASHVAGTVRYSTDGKEWKPLEKGDLLSVGNSVRTSDDGEAVLVWFSGNAVKISPLSQLTISKLARGKSSTEKSELYLEKGRVFARAKKISGTDSRFFVRTPIAYAGVRGTEFTVEGADKQSLFIVVDGSIEVSARGEDRLLEAGFQVGVIEGMPPGEVARVSENVMKSLRKESAELDKLVQEDDSSGNAKSSTDEDEDEELTDMAVEEVIENNLDNILNDVEPMDDHFEF